MLRWRKPFNDDRSSGDTLIETLENSPTQVKNQAIVYQTISKPQRLEIIAKYLLFNRKLLILSNQSNQHERLFFCAVDVFQSPQVPKVYESLWSLKIRKKLGKNQP